nr:calcium-binding protein [uncultured Duganella sp.]
MTYATGTNNGETFYMSTFGAPTAGTDGHGYNALGGNDIVYGSSYIDVIQGGAGDDELFGYGGNDTLVGQNGNDRLWGGDGNDFIAGGSGDNGNDLLVGGNGLDRMNGGGGNDTYVHLANSGNDTINDGGTETGAPGYGGGVDYIQFTGVTAADLVALRQDGSNDLWLTSAADWADGSVDDGVIVKDFYANDVNTFVEYVYTSDQLYIDLTQLL